MNINSLYALPRAKFNREKQGYVAIALFGVLDEFGGTVYEIKTDAEIQAHSGYAAKLQEVEDGYSVTEYKSKRAAAYAALNQDEMRFDDTVNSTTTWVDAISAIKAKYPKLG